MKPIYLSVIIPAHNEARRLPLTLIDIDKHLSKADFDYEIIVVDNGSNDGTSDIVRKFSEIMPNLKVVESEKGKGYAIKKGMLEAKGEYRLFTDADNSTSIDQFNNMIPYFKSGYDVVIGSRDVKGSRLEPPQAWYRSLAGNIGNLIIQALVLPGIWDTQCGFKCFSKKAAERIFLLQRTGGWGFDVEILALAREIGYKIKEIPINWINDPTSKVGALAYLKVLRDVFVIRILLWRDVYEIR